jgi:hypothetical protein
VDDTVVLDIAVDSAMDKEVLQVDLLEISLLVLLLVHPPVDMQEVVDSKAVTAVELTIFLLEAL